MTSSTLVFAVLAAPLLFGTVAVAGAMVPGSKPQLVERLSRCASTAGVVVALVAGGVVLLHGSVQSPLLGWKGVGITVRLDPLSVAMLVMIALLATVIVRFSRTYLDGDDRHGDFLGRLGATIAAVELLVLSGNLGGLVVAWVLTSLALHRLLVFYPDRPRAVIAARKKYLAARVGDGFLIAGCALLYHRFGTGDLQEIFDGARAAVQAGWALGAVDLAAVCIGVAALLKSAQFPTHGWLVEVMETPTPVSALLHAGILNAGPFLVIRMAYVIDGARPATTLLIVAGGFTATFASVVLLTQPSVKVALGYSSAAHMGFMLMVCGMGLYPAALLHLVAHSFYKAHAFLSSGSVIDEARAAKVSVPRRLGSAWRIAGSAVIALAFYLPLALLWGLDLGGDPVLVAIGAILVMGTTQLIAPALDSAGGVTATLRAVGLALAVTSSFFALEAGAHLLLADTVPEAVGREAIQLVLVAVILIGFATVVVLQILEPARSPSPRRRALAIHLRNGLYANAAFDRVVGALRGPTVEPQRTR